MIRVPGVPRTVPPEAPELRVGRSACGGEYGGVAALRAFITIGLALTALVIVSGAGARIRVVRA